MPFSLSQFDAEAPFDISSRISTASALAEAPEWQARFSPSGVEILHWNWKRSTSDWPWGPRSPDTADHVLAGDHGWLVGYDNGEFGGGLVELNRAKEQIKAHRLELPASGWSRPPQNVKGIYRIDDRVLVLRGLTHLGMDEGSIEFFRGDIGKDLVLEEVLVLPASPQAFVATAKKTLMVSLRQGLLECGVEPRIVNCWEPVLAGGLAVPARPWIASSVDTMSKCDFSGRAWRFVTCSPFFIRR